MIRTSAAVIVPSHSSCLGRSASLQIWGLFLYVKCVHYLGPIGGSFENCWISWCVRLLQPALYHAYTDIGGLMGVFCTTWWACINYYHSQDDAITEVLVMWSPGTERRLKGVIWRHTISCEDDQLLKNVMSSFCSLFFYLTYFKDNELKLMLMYKN